ncbi:hypothetical protein L916_02474, partial [Phytophthora nicotianae]
MVANKQLSAYFCEHLGQGVFRCKIRNKERKQVPGSGYSNLLAHLAGKHKGYPLRSTLAARSKRSGLSRKSLAICSSGSSGSSCGTCLS